MTDITNMIFGAGLEIRGDFIKGGLADGYAVRQGMILVELKDGSNVEEECEIGRLMKATGPCDEDGTIEVIILADQSGITGDPCPCPYRDVVHMSNVYAFVGTVAFWQNAMKVEEVERLLGKGDAA